MNNKQLLQKYVDTGTQLPEYQVNNLPDGLKNTYIRKRLISAVQIKNGLAYYEFELATPEQRFQYAMRRAEKDYEITNEQFKLLTPDQQNQYVMNMVDRGHFIGFSLFKSLLPHKRFEYTIKRVENGDFITSNMFELLTPDQRFEYSLKRGQTTGISDMQFELLTPDQRFQYIMNLPKLWDGGYDVSNKQFELLEPDQKGQFFMKLAETSYFYDDKFKLLTQDWKGKFAINAAKKNQGITKNMFELLTPEQQEIFKDNEGHLFDSIK